MTQHVLAGFGFGPIQGGLFAAEAFKSGAFSRIVVAEIDRGLIDAVRANNGSYYVNIACADHIEAVRVDDVEILDPKCPDDRKVLLDALAEATEIATCLPAVSFYTMGGANSVAQLLGEGLAQASTDAKIIYTAENDNHAAEALRRSVETEMPGQSLRDVQFLNTVIGKMSRVVTDSAEIEQMRLRPIADGFDRAFVVEQFNRILVCRCTLKGFRPGIDVFVEKEDLLPFEEAKLYGHNAIHALLAYLGEAAGHTRMTDLKNDPAIMRIGRDAFVQESGAALIAKYAHLNDELFTEAGYRDYANDLLDRMTNPYLGDMIARAARDPLRKLAYDDRIFGTMRLALSMKITPSNMALGAAAAIGHLLQKAEGYRLPPELRSDSAQQLDRARIAAILNWIWQDRADAQAEQLIDLVHEANGRLPGLLNR